MDVNVSLLDRKFWSSPEQLSNSISEQVADMVRKRGNGDFARTRQSIKSQAREALSQFAKVGAVDPTDVERLAIPLNQFVDDRFAEADRHFAQAIQKLGLSYKALPLTNRLALLFEAQSDLETGYGSIRLAQDRLSADLRSKIEAVQGTLAATKVAAAVTAADKAASQMKDVVNGFIGQQGLLSDPLAASVVYAPESYWRRPEAPEGFNETYASGAFGNTDIAIKMESVGNFTIKGVRLDASKITQASFAVGRQAVKTVAAVYGMPLSSDTKGAVSTSAAAFAETPIGFASPDQRRSAADELLVRRRLARLTVLETILIQRVALTNRAATANADAARVLAVKTVKDVFAAYRADLDAPQTSSK